MPFKDLKNHILGEDFELSLVFVGDKVSRKLNKKFLKKDRPTNVLSFPLDENSGEIFLNLSEVKRSHEKFGMSKGKFSAFLFVHGALHLKGLAHGSRMERLEKQILEHFEIE